MPDDQTQAPPPVQPPPTTPAPPPSNPEKDARMWNMFCHLGILIPCLPCIVTLLIWQLKKNEFPSVDVHGKRALNFQISVLIVSFAVWVAAFVLSIIHIGFLLFMLLPFIGLGALVLAIIAGIKANNGEDYKYPWSLELIK